MMEAERIKMNYIRYINKTKKKEK